MAIKWECMSLNVTYGQIDIFAIVVMLT